MKSTDERVARYAAQVGRCAQLAALDAVLDVLRRGERDDLDFEATREAAIEKIEREWLSADASKTALIVDNACRRAMNAGRLGELIKAKAARPFWLFSAVLDDVTSDTCFDCDMTVLAVGHSWWKTHIPLLHFSCRSAICSLTAAQAKAIGVTKSPPTVEVEDGYGTMDDLLDVGDAPGRYEAGALDGVED